jgi:hypothetical protein
LILTAIITTVAVTRWQGWIEAVHVRCCWATHVWICTAWISIIERGTQGGLANKGRSFGEELEKEMVHTYNYTHAAHVLILIMLGCCPAGLC